jgi:glucosamine--fructose-6-phosphate aminotransferase (isomerizing)
MTEDDARTAALMAEGSTDAPRDPRRLARAERTRAEALAQGEAIAHTLRQEQNSRRAVAATLRARSLRRVVIAGCGDSWFCGIAARPALEALLGIPVEPVQAHDWAHWASGTADASTLLIGITSGGATPAVIAAMQAARGRGATVLGVSNTAGSPALTAYDFGLMVHATRRGWPTQASTATIAALIALAAEVAGDGTVAHELHALPDAIAETTRRLDDAVAAQAQAWHAAPLLLFSAGGPHLAAALFGAAKIRELSPLHALATPLEEAHHYRFPKRDDHLFVLCPDAPGTARAVDTLLVANAVGARTVALLPEGEAEVARRTRSIWRLPAVHPWLAPILYSVPLHLFAHRFALARAEAGLGLAASPL